MIGVMLMFLLMVCFGFICILGFGYVLWILFIGWLAFCLGYIFVDDVFGMWICGVMFVNVVLLVIDIVDVVCFVVGDWKELVVIGCLKWGYRWVI